MRESKPSGEVSPWALAGLGMQFFVAILLFVYAGNWLDRRFGTAPLFLLAGLFLGGGGSFWTAYRRLTGDAQNTKPRLDDDENRETPT